MDCFVNSKTLLICCLLTLLAWSRPFRMDLDGRKFETLDDNALWSQVGDLDLSFNQLNRLPTWTVTRWQNLEVLDLGSNKFTNVPAQVFLLKRLRRLSLRMNPITSLAGPWQQMTGLNRLDAASLKVSECPKNLGLLKNLTHLDLSGNRLETVPDGLGNLKSMITLSLAENQLTSIPAGLGGCRALSRLNLRENNIQDLPPQLAQLSKLAILDLSGNELESLPDELTHLQNLRELNLVGNPLKQLPANLPRMKSLRILFLDERSMSIARFIQLQDKMPWVQLVLLRNRH